MVNIDELQAQELRRARWRRERETLNLLDTTSDTFAIGGLASYTTDIHARLVILPPDPEAWLVEFDEAFWEWWLAERQLPFGDRKVTWWYEHRPTSHAAVRFRSISDDRWDSYLALHRHGGLELGLGRDAARESTVPEARDGSAFWREFYLTSIVGRLWAIIDLYGAAVEYLSLTGPWEIAFTLRRTEGAHLAHFGEGWREPRYPWSDRLQVCSEPNLLCRREIEGWPTGEDARELAFSFGGWIEDAWGTQLRRFLARQGPSEGEFAVDRALQ